MLLPRRPAFRSMPKTSPQPAHSITEIPELKLCDFGLTTKWIPGAKPQECFEGSHVYASVAMDQNRPRKVSDTHLLLLFIHVFFVCVYSHILLLTIGGRSSTLSRCYGIMIFHG